VALADQRINRELITALEAEIDLPVYFGNRNWAPYVEDTVAACGQRDSPCSRVHTSAWGGYSSCTQLRRGHRTARTAAGQGAPELVKLRQYFDHPLFVEMFTKPSVRQHRLCLTELRERARLVSPRTPFPSRPDRVAARLVRPPGAYASRWSPLRQAMKTTTTVWQSRSGRHSAVVGADIGDH